MYGQSLTNSVCLYAFLYIFVYIYAQIYTFYKYIRIEILSIQSSNGLRECKTKRQDGCGGANKEERCCDIPSRLLFLFVRFKFRFSFEVHNDLMQFAQWCSH